MKSSFKDRIKKIIIDRCDGSNQEFAKKIGINVSTIGIWDDEHFPKGDVLQRLNKILNIDIHWLLNGEGEPYLDEQYKTITRTRTPITQTATHTSTPAIQISYKTREGESVSISIENGLDGVSDILKSGDTRLLDMMLNLADSIKDRSMPDKAQDLTHKIRELEDENEKLQRFIDENLQQLSNLNSSLLKIIQENPPPKQSEERRKSMKSLNSLAEEVGAATMKVGNE